jgi:hypothetical protein
MSDHTIWLATTGGECLTIIDDFYSLSYTLAVNYYGELSLTVPHDYDLGLFRAHNRLLVFRDDRLEGETCWFIVEQGRVLEERGQQVIRIEAASAPWLLSGRIFPFDDDTPEATKTDAADDVLKAYVRENLGASAVGARSLTPYIGVSADAGAGPTVAVNVPYANLLDACRDIADSTKADENPDAWVYFDIVQTDLRNGNLEFRTYVGARGASHGYRAEIPVIFSPDFGNMISVERTFEYRDEYTYAYVGGRSYAGAREVWEGEDTARSGRSLFGRRESFYNAADPDDPEADVPIALAQGRPRRSLHARIIDTPDCRYGRDWSHGDIVGGSVEGETYDYRINAVTVTVERGAEAIDATLESTDAIGD